MFHIQPLPITETVQSSFAAYLAQSVTWTTVRSYLSAIRFYQIKAGFPDPSLTPCPRLPYVLNGIHKSSPDCNTLHRLPLTPDHLRSIHATWSKSTVSYDKSMLWAAFCIGFFGFLRSGEFTHTFAAGTESATLLVSDVSIDSRSNPRILTIRLRKSKTDQFFKGTDIHLGRTGDILCPVSAMLSYMAIRPNTKGPLFIFQDGTPLSRQQLINHLRKALSQAGICPSGYSGHSFRIGAATTAAAIGMSDSTIKSLGRWKSTAVTSYIRKNENQFATASATLARYTNCS